MSSKQYIMSQQGCIHYLLDYDQGRGNFKWYNSVHADVHTYVCIAPEASEKLLTSLALWIGIFLWDRPWGPLVGGVGTGSCALSLWFIATQEYSFIGISAIKTVLLLATFLINCYKYLSVQAKDHCQHSLTLKRHPLRDKLLFLHYNEQSTFCGILAACPIGKEDIV